MVVREAITHQLNWTSRLYVSMQVTIAEVLTNVAWSSWSKLLPIGGMITIKEMPNLLRKCQAKSHKSKGCGFKLCFGEIFYFLVKYLNIEFLLLEITCGPLSCSRIHPALISSLENCRNHNQTRNRWTPRFLSLLRHSKLKIE